MSSFTLNTNTTSNKRIAKNTLMLYIRMLVMMIVSLITSRVYLQALGETDFGIFNIVGGLVLSFSFISSTMQVATQRFLNYEMGKGDEESVRNVFNVSMIIYIGISIIVITLAETVGIWFLNTKMNIPEDRMIIANWVFQLSIIGFVFQMLRIPYNASIIAYENMNFYAYFSICEAILKLGAAMAVLYVGVDKLLAVSFFTTIVYFTITAGYKIYCNRKYSITKFRFKWDKQTAIQISSFSGWSLYGSGCIMGANQGVDLVLNFFWGVTVNAALGIASQLSHAINQLVSNFQVAYNPQLVKLYAQNKTSELFSLIRKSSKFSFFLLLYAFVPIFFCSDYILHLWLGRVPEYTEIFVRLMLIYVLIDSLQAPLWLSVLATGDIKKYHLITGTMMLVNIPLVFVLMKLGLSPLYAWLSRIVINCLIFVERLVYLKFKMGFPIGSYIKTTIIPCTTVLLLIIPSSIITSGLFDDTLRLVILLASNTIIVSVLILLLGLDKEERKSVLGYIKKIRK